MLAAVIAFVPSLGWEEMFLLLVLGLLLYGRNLPEAGRNLGRVVAQLKRSFHDFKEQLDREGEIRDVKKAFEDTAREVRNVANVPRAIGNPGQALRELTREAMASPPPAPTAAPETAEPPPAAHAVGTDREHGHVAAPHRNGSIDGGTHDGAHQPADRPADHESDAR